LLGTVIHVVECGRLFADAELLNDLLVGFRIVALQVIKQTAAFAHHFEQSAAGRVVLRMPLEMPGQFPDAFTQYGDLDLWASGVGIVRPVLADDFCFFLGG